MGVDLEQPRPPVSNMQDKPKTLPKKRPAEPDNARSLPEGPEGNGKESQCLVSPNLLDRLSLCQRTDDICTASVTYYLKSVTAMEESSIRAVVAYLRNPELTNRQVASRVRKTIPNLAEDRHIMIRYSVTEFIMNTLDPTLSDQRVSGTSSSGKSGTSEPKDLKADDKEIDGKIIKAKKKVSTSVLRSTKKIVRTSQLDLSHRASVRLKKASAQDHASHQEAPSPTNKSGKRAGKGTAKVAAPLAEPTNGGGHESDVEEEEEGEEGEHEATKLVEMGSLKMKVKKRHLDDIVIETRRQVSTVSHAMSLKADSEEVAEGVALLKTLLASDVGNILEADRQWMDDSSDDDDDLAMGRKRERAKSSSPGREKGSKSPKRKDGQDGQKKLEQDPSSSSRGRASRSDKGRAERDGSEDRSSRASATTESSRRSSRDEDARRRKSRAEEFGEDGGSDEASDSASDTEERDKRKGSKRRGTRKGRASKDSAGRRQSQDKKRRASSDKSIKDSEAMRGSADTAPRESTDGSEASKKKVQRKSEVQPEEIRYMSVDLNQPFADRPKTPVAPDQQAAAQRYFETKGISELFEMLLSRLVLDQPSRPLDYLIELTHRMNTARRKEQEIADIESRHTCHVCTSSARSSQCRTTGIADFRSSMDSSLTPVDDNL